MATSQNGWPVNPPRRARQVPGTNIRLVVADGPAGDLLLRFAAEFDRLVEDIDTAAGGVLDDWGWADRPIRGGTDISNHASATAIDLNATRHPLGAVGTFDHAERTALRRLLDRYEGVIRWGGDYSGRKDEMHFEINASRAAVERVAARLSQEDDMQLTDRVDWDRINGLGPDYLGHKILGTWQHAKATRAEIAGLRAAVDKLAGAVAGDDLTAAELRAAVKAGVAEALAEGTVDVDVTITGATS